MGTDAVPDIPAEVESYLDEIAERLWSKHGAVMAGPGFSRDAMPNYDRTYGYISMNSLNSGTPSTETARLTGVSLEGIEVTVGRENFFLPFAQYPWFEHCSVEELRAVEFTGHSLNWEEAVIELGMEALRSPGSGSEMVTLAGWRKMREHVRQRQAVAQLGRAGGKSTSRKKAAAARTNGRKGGRPRKAESAPVVGDGPERG